MPLHKSSVIVIISFIIVITIVSMTNLCPQQCILAVLPKGYLLIINKYHHYYYCQAEIVMKVRVEVRDEGEGRV